MSDITDPAAELPQLNPQLSSPPHPRKIRLSFFQLSVSAFGFIAVLLLGGILIRRTTPPTASRAAALPPNLIVPANDYFKIPLTNFPKVYGPDGYKAAQQFNGGLVLREFWDSRWPYLMAGHLGAFYAPPFFSGGTTAADAFTTGLTLANRNSVSAVGLNINYENSASHSLTVGTWSPAKTEIQDIYDSTTYVPNLKVKGVKISLPGTGPDGKPVRGFALKASFTNGGSTALPLSVFLSDVVPNLGADNVWNWNVHGTGYTDLTIISPPNLASGKNYAIVSSVANPKVYLLLGLANISSGTGVFWQAGDISAHASLISQFRANQGKLTNTSQDTSAAGTVLGYAFNFPSLNPQTTAGFTLLGFVGGSVSEVESQWTSHINYFQANNLDAESYTEKQVNARIAALFADRLPKFSSGDQQLNRLYYNSALQYLLLKWDTYSWIAENNDYAKSVAYFPWKQGVDLVQTQADPAFNRQFLLRLLTLDYANCNAYSPLGVHRCAVTNSVWPYSYSIPSVVRLVAEYIRVSGDTAFLTAKIGTTRVVDLLARFVNQIDARAGGQNLVVGSATIPDTASINTGSGNLADFGTDHSLYELILNSCVIGFDYSGQVISPNAERYMAHQLLAELYSSLGETASADQHLSWAANNKLAVQKLWDSTKNWFRINSKYPSADYYFYPVLNMLDFPGLLTDDQKGYLLSTIDGTGKQFIGPNGFYSTKGGNNGGLSNAFCSRTDHQGPGLYSGTIGVYLADLFQNSRKEWAYTMLNKYSYLADMPVMDQQYDAAFSSGQHFLEARPWHFESMSFTQSLIMGMMGLNPSSGTASDQFTWIKPRIPESLLDKSEVSFGRAFSQSHAWSLTAAKGADYSLFITPAFAGGQVDNFVFGWDGDKGAAVQINNLKNSTYNITFDNPVMTPLTGIVTSSNTINFPVPAGKSKIFVRNAFQPTPTPVPVSVYPSSQCSIYTSGFQSKSLDSWWGSVTPKPPTSGIDAYVTRLWNGSVQDLVFSGGNVWIRQGTGSDIGTLAGKNWTQQSLSLFWGSDATAPPLSGFDEVYYRISGGAITETVFASSNVWFRKSTPANPYQFPAVWQKQTVSLYFAQSGCTSQPPGVTTYASRIINGQYSDTVGYISDPASNTADLYYRTAAGTDAAAVSGICFRKTNFYSTWGPAPGLNIPNVPTYKPLVLSFQSVGGKHRQAVINTGQYYYQDCQ